MMSLDQSQDNNNERNFDDDEIYLKSPEIVNKKQLNQNKNKLEYISLP